MAIGANGNQEGEEDEEEEKEEKEKAKREEKKEETNYDPCHISRLPPGPHHVPPPSPFSPFHFSFSSF